MLKNYFKLDKNHYDIEGKKIFLKIKLPELLLKEVEKKIKDLVGDYSVQVKEAEQSKKEDKTEKEQKEKENKEKFKK